MKLALILITILFSLTSLAHDTDIDITQYAEAFTQLPNGDVIIEYPRVKTSSQEFYFSQLSDYDKLCEAVFGFKRGYDVFYKSATCFGTDLIATYYKNSHYVVEEDGTMQLDSQKLIDDGDSCKKPKHRYITQITCSEK